MHELRDVRRALRDAGRTEDGPDTREARRDVRELERSFRRDVFDLRHGVRRGELAGEELLEGVRQAAGGLVAGLRGALGARESPGAQVEQVEPEAGEPPVESMDEAPGVPEAPEAAQTATDAPTSLRVELAVSVYAEVRLSLDGTSAAGALDRIG